MELVLDILKEFIALTPVVAVTAPLITLLVNAAKQAGLPDGRAGLLSGLLNLLAWIGLAVASRLDRLDEAQSVIQALTQLMPVLIALALSILASDGAFKLGRKIGLPGFHKSK